MRPRLIRMALEYDGTEKLLVAKTCRSLKIAPGHQPWRANSFVGVWVVGAPVPVPVPVPDRRRTFRGALNVYAPRQLSVCNLYVLPLLILRWMAVRPSTADCRPNCLFLSWSHDGLRWCFPRAFSATFCANLLYRQFRGNYICPAARPGTETPVGLSPFRALRREPRP